jgi:hypothetical protein
MAGAIRADKVKAEKAATAAKKGCECPAVLFVLDVLGAVIGNTAGTNRAKKMKAETAAAAARRGCECPAALFVLLLCLACSSFLC